MFGIRPKNSNKWKIVVMLFIAMVIAMLSSMTVFGQKRDQVWGVSNLVPFRVGDKFGYSDRKKNLVISPRYDGAGIFIEGRAFVWRDRKCGYIDEKGHEIVPIRYNECHPFSDGLGVVLLGKWGAVDRTGRMVVPLKYAEISGFVNGVAAVKIKGRQSPGLLTTENTQEGVIDTTGKLVIPFGKFMNIWWYSDGLAHFNNMFLNQPQSDRKGFIDKTGRVVFDASNYDCSVCSFSEGLAAVSNGGNRENQEWGFVNKLGKIVIPLKFRFAKNFSEGLAIVVDKNNSVFFIDKRGRKRITLNSEDYENLSVNELRSFSGGLVAVPKKGKGWGFINKSGKQVIAPKYSGVSSFGFRNGIVEVWLKDMDKGFFIDATGTEYLEQSKNPK